MDVIVIRARTSAVARRISDAQSRRRDLGVVVRGARGKPRRPHARKDGGDIPAAGRELGVTVLRTFTSTAWFLHTVIQAGEPQTLII
jgi:hypothetical protein